MSRINWADYQLLFNLKKYALMQQTRFDIWYFGSDNHLLNQLYSFFSERICLFGGLDTHGVLRTGTPSEVRSETAAYIKFARGKKLILSSGTGTTPDVPSENVRVIKKKGQKKGSDLWI